jgi:acyl-CoA reductase-like NAD-dependent aldehyde dehydrogenase
MTSSTSTLSPPPLRHMDRFFIDGEWVAASTNAVIDVIDSDTEQLYFSVAEANAQDIARAVEAARSAFDEGPWPRMTHAERAGWLRALAAGLKARN